MHHIISDIHGCFYTLQKLIEKVRAQDDSPQFVFVGDYVDRGFYSKECVEFVMQLQSEGAVCLRGNHDDIIDWMCNMECQTDLREKIGSDPNLITIGSWWLMNGLFTTIRSYSTVTEDVALDVLMTIFVSSIPESHKVFLRGLKMFWENDTHFATHAYLNPRQILPSSLTLLPESGTMNLWDRFPIKHETVMYGPPTPAGIGCDEPAWDRIGVFGHTPVVNYGSIAPIKHGNLRLIDTGAFQENGFMTAYCCEQDDWILQETDSQDLVQGENK